MNFELREHWINNIVNQYTANILNLVQANFTIKYKPANCFATQMSGLLNTVMTNAVMGSKTAKISKELFFSVLTL